MKSYLKVFIIVSLASISISLNAYGDSLEISASKTTFWNNRFWYITHSFSADCQGSDCMRTHEIYSYDVKSKKEPVLEYHVELPVRDIWLVGSTDKLWLISNKTAGYFNEGEYVALDVDESFQKFSRPFYYRGNVTVITEKNDEFIIKSLIKDKWTDVESFNLEPKINCRLDYCLEAIDFENVIHVFLSNDGVIYHHDGIPSGENSVYSEWQKVAETKSGWTSSVVEGRPVVFYSFGSELFSGIEGKRLSHNGWEKIYAGASSLCGGCDIRVFSIDNNSYFIFDTGVFRTKGIVVENGKVTSSKGIGKLSIIGIVGLHELILLIILIIVGIIYLFNPYWHLKYSVTRYLEVREYDRARVNINDIMTRDYSKANYMKIKALREKNALYLKTKISLIYPQGNPFQNIRSGIICFEEAHEKIRIKFIVKFPIIVLIMIIWMLSLMVSLFFRMSGIDSTIDMMFYLMVAFGVIVFPIITIFTYKKTNKKIKEYFDIFLVYLGIEENIEISKLV